ncbi:MAG: hypothetical protein JXB10_05805 [Pirellulales bacterium]|nr:hypothetical protein [Pirellulales bacterium]
MEIRHSRTARFAFLVIAGSLLLGVGCGRKIPEIVPVSGKVTLEGGAWPKPGTITFAPLKPAKGFPSRPGVGHFNTDGSFVAETGQYEGLIPGEYRISVSCWEVVPTGSSDGKGYLPKKFCNPTTSGLTLTIEADRSDPVIWEHDFPRAKP